MKRGYNELVGIQVRCSRLMKRYSLTHHYRWRVNGETKESGSMRSFDMRRHVSVDEILRSLREVYAPAILSIWRQITSASVQEYLQLEVTSRPDEIGLGGSWDHWAER